MCIVSLVWNCNAKKPAVSKVAMTQVYRKSRKNSLELKQENEAPHQKVTVDKVVVTKVLWRNGVVTMVWNNSAAAKCRER